MIFGRSEKWWREQDGYASASEIIQQPYIWEKVFQQVVREKEEIQAFLELTLKQKEYDVILTGAGTSEYIGNTLFSYLGKKLDHRVKSIATTDLVSCPENYLSKERATLLISFARSGNSPESVGAIEVANCICSNIKHLILTCNAQGDLYHYGKDREGSYTFLLPEESNDKAFAMTSSFTSMLLSVLFIFHLEEMEEFYRQVKMIIENCENFMEKRWKYVLEVIQTYDFKQIVYLGSNTNKGIAQEAALKMCELCAGKIHTVFDSPMGFRHGPKSVINEQTLIVLCMSDDVYTRRYEIDVLEELSKERKGNKILLLSSKEESILLSYSDFTITFKNTMNLENVLLGLEYILVAQLLGLFKSLQCACTPDHPCVGGEVNRVVKGVSIYPYQKS